MSRQTKSLADNHTNGPLEQREQIAKEDVNGRKIKRLSSRSPKPVPNPDQQPLSSDGGFANWQTVIWREWCRCKDEDYVSSSN